MSDQKITELKKKKQGPRGKRLQEKQNQLKSTYISSSNKPTLNTQNELDNLIKRNHSPKVNLIEHNLYFIIRIDLPGIDINKINIELLEFNTILVNVFKQEEIYTNKHSTIYNECKYGKISRRIKLKSFVDKDTIVTNYFNGILRITINKTIAIKESTQEFIQEPIQESIKQPIKEFIQESIKEIPWSDVI